MSLPSSGTLSIAEIVAEFGGSAPHSLSEYYRGGGLVPNTGMNSAVPTSGAISVSNFYGATNTIITSAVASSMGALYSDSGSEGDPEGLYGEFVHYVYGYQSSSYNTPTPAGFPPGAPGTGSITPSTHNGRDIAAYGYTHIYFYTQDKGGNPGETANYTNTWCSLSGDSTGFSVSFNVDGTSVGVITGEYDADSGTTYYLLGSTTGSTPLYLSGSTWTLTLTT